MSRNMSWILAIGALVLMGVGTWIDIALPASPDLQARERVVTPDEGAWHCAAGATSPGETVEFTATAPTDAQGRIRIDQYGEGQRQGGGAHAVPALGQVEHASPEDLGPLGVVAIWRDAPVVFSRTWDRDIRGEPAGLVHGPCQPTPSRDWYLPGMTTAGGATARLEIANPFETDAAVSVTLLTSRGEETPELLRNVGVPARSVRTVELNDHAPERDDLGAIVSVRAGRVIAEGWQSLDPGIGGIAGMSLLQLSVRSDERWVLPWLPFDTDDAWIWVANVGDRRASIGLTLHTADGGIPAEGSGEITVPASSVRRIDLASLTSEDVEPGGLTVTSDNGVPIVVSAGSRVTAETPERTGFSVLLATTEHDDLWAVPAPGGEARANILGIVNPTAEVSTVTVTIATTDGSITPRALREVEIPAGAAVTIDLSEIEPDLEGHTVIVKASSSGVVVGGLSWAQEGRLRLAVHPAVGSAGWAARVAARVERDPTLLRRVGTRLGPQTGPVDEMPEDVDPERVDE